MYSPSRISRLLAFRVQVASDSTAESESLKVATETTNNSCFLAPARPLAPPYTHPAPRHS